MRTHYLVVDTFNRRTLSRHRSLAAAVKAEQRFHAAVARANGPSSYIPTSIRRENTSRASCDGSYETSIRLTEAEARELYEVEYYP